MGVPKKTRRPETQVPWDLSEKKTRREGKSQPNFLSFWALGRGMRGGSWRGDEEKRSRD